MRYSTEQRLLALHLGEILIDTAKDPRRPFLVQTEHGRLRALGTRFSVRCGASDSLLNVYAGAVEVRSASGLQVVNAGQQLRFDGRTLGPLQVASAAREAWSHGPGCWPTTCPWSNCWRNWGAIATATWVATRPSPNCR